MISAYYHLCYLCTTLLHIILFHKPRTHAASSFLGERGPEHWPAHSCPRPHHQPLAEPGPSNICWTHTQNPGVQGFGFSRLLPRFHNLPNWINMATLHTQDVSEGSGQSSCETEEEEHSVSDQQVHSYEHGEAGHPHVRTRQGCCCSRMSASGHRHHRRKGHPNRPQPHSCLSKGRNKGRKEGMGGDPAGCPQGPKPLPQRNSRVPPNRELT